MHVENVLLSCNLLRFIFYNNNDNVTKWNKKKKNNNNYIYKVGLLSRSLTLKKK